MAIKYIFLIKFFSSQELQMLLFIFFLVMEEMWWGSVGRVWDKRLSNLFTLFHVLILPIYEKQQQQQQQQLSQFLLSKSSLCILISYNGQKKRQHYHLIFHKLAINSKQPNSNSQHWQFPWKILSFFVLWSIEIKNHNINMPKSQFHGQ